MAQLALPPGAVRRRTAFGLLDADGWTWASVKATFWFILIIFLLGYVPDRAYYLTVSPTVDLGYNAISPINFCPAENNRGDRALPCPAPGGAVVPWDMSPTELDLPVGRTRAAAFASGENLYIVGGETADGATASVLATTVSEEGNFVAPWAEGPALPEARSGALVLNLSGTPYVIGGADSSGAPTDTVYQGVVEEGVLTGWEADDTLKLPIPLADLAGVPTGTGMYIFGGRTSSGLSAATYHSVLTTTGQAKLQAWVDLTELPLPEARAGATAAANGGSVHVIGGAGPDGATNSVFYLGLDTHGQPAVNPSTERPFGWGVSVNQSAAAALPEPRIGHTTFVNSGAVYVLGGFTADGSVAATNFWTVPDPADGTIKEWLQLDATDLPQPRTGAAVSAIGQHVFVTGGSDGAQLLTSSARADLAPRTPFFRLGLFGVTVPALSIKGEIGQQLGYLVAGGAVMGNFALLIAIGWMFSHKPETYRFFRFVTRGRFRPPPEDEYRP